jgi:hypothetical protein
MPRTGLRSLPPRHQTTTLNGAQHLRCALTSPKNLGDVGETWSQAIAVLWNRGQAGVSAVEFALILPIVVLLTFGMLTGGLAFHQQLSLTHAAREAARYGAVEPAADITGEDGLLEQIIARAEDSAHGVLGDLDNGEVDGAGICVAYVAATGQRATKGADVHETGSTDRCFEDNRGSEPRIQVRIGRDAEIMGVFINWDIALRASALARHEAFQITSEPDEEDD